MSYESLKKSNLYFVAKSKILYTLKLVYNKELWDNTFTLSVYLQMHNIINRDQLIWQIEEYLYPTSILGMIYHIRADAFIFFGL